ncbi:hypothetical protein [Sphingobacterium bambusae]|uniref:Uncharacterized protein n=1 Tax=Sphingobacterium bambusae TaxID=662858 RepID=A0ABW6BG78_9SPHI|nr:hypothetical protein [Sphingobacterium bambusae]WPL49684.1 hypothetical protein SCB77_04365 [Sphingobacterium bambusae]
MKSLEVHARGRVMYVKYSTERKPFGSLEVTLLAKNGVSIYLFRKEQGTWRLAYGFLQENIKEACIDAIILRFDTSVVEILPKPKGLWHVFVNDIYTSSISSDGKKWDYHFEEDSCITDDHMKKYIGIISLGQVKWIDRDGR